MGSSRPPDTTGGGERGIRGLGTETEVSVEPKSRGRVVGEELLRRWKHWIAIVATGVTTWFLYGINDTWSTDAVAFGVITVVIFVYTVVTLPGDIE